MAINRNCQKYPKLLSSNKLKRMRRWLQMYRTNEFGIGAQRMITDTRFGHAILQVNGLVWRGAGQS